MVYQRPGAYVAVQISKLEICRLGSLGENVLLSPDVQCVFLFIVIRVTLKTGQLGLVLVMQCPMLEPGVPGS